MKIKGQHGEFGWSGSPDSPYPSSKRQIEVEKDERVAIKVKNKQTGMEEEVMVFFMPGVLTLDWDNGATIDV